MKTDKVGYLPAMFYKNIKSFIIPEELMLEIPKDKEKAVQLGRQVLNDPRICQNGNVTSFLVLRVDLAQVKKFEGGPPPSIILPS